MRMSVTLTPQTEAEIRRLVETGRYSDADEAVQTALKLVNEQYDAKLANLRELIREGFESPSAGELTEEMWDEIERSSEERYLRGEKPSPHVVPWSPSSHHSRGGEARHRRFAVIHA